MEDQIRDYAYMHLTCKMHRLKICTCIYLNGTFNRLIVLEYQVLCARYTISNHYTHTRAWDGGATHPLKPLSRSISKPLITSTAVSAAAVALLRTL